MSMMRRIKERFFARKCRVRNKINRVITRPYKAVVFRSNKHIYASLFDVLNNKTLCGFSSLNIENNSSNNAVVAKMVGEGFGKKCLELGVSSIVLDRGAYLYHGKIAALADGIRSVGISL